MKRLAITLLGLLLLSACAEHSDPAAAQRDSSGPFTIYTVNYPLAWAAEQLAGDTAQVVFPADDDVDPAFWQPNLDTIAAFQRADLILLNGAGYAKWLSKVSLPSNHTVDTSKAFADQLITVDGDPLHSHGPGGEHSHGTLAFTTWLDLDFFLAQVDATAVAMSTALPEHAPVIKTRQEQLHQTIKVLDKQLLALGKELDGAPLLYSHPVYQYFNRRYSLNGEALHWEPDQTPTESQWSALDTLLVRHPARFMVWEAEPTAATRAQLEGRGVKTVVLRPMGNRPARGDFAKNLRADIATLNEQVQVFLKDSNSLRRSDP